MAEKTPAQLVVSAFQSEDGADAALDAVVRAMKGKHVKIREAAVIRNDTGGKLHIKERGDVRTGAGAASGAALGAAIGLFGGPLGALVGGATGAAIGGLTARLRDTGIREDRIKEIGAALTPGTSAVVAMIEQSEAAAVEAELQRAGGSTLATHHVSDDLEQDLASGKAVAYDVVPAAGGTVSDTPPAEEPPAPAEGATEDPKA